MGSTNATNSQGRWIGVEIGGTKLQVVIGTPPQIEARWRGRVDAARGAEGIREQIEGAVRELTRNRAARGIGVGFGGPINWQSGRIERSHHVSGWQGFELADWLRSASGLPVAADNDANVAALGEAMAGAGAGHQGVFYVTMGSGVGGGMVTGGGIYHGRSPGECEFGHLRLDKQGTIVESRCSGWAVDRRIRRMIEENPESVLAMLAGRATGGEARHLAEALKRGDAGAGRILGEVAEDLALAFSHVVHLFHPEVLILGGGLSLLGEPLRAAVAAQLPRFVMEAFHPVPPVRLAQLGEDAVPVGAMQLAMERAR